MTLVIPSPEKSERNKSILSFLLASSRKTALTKSWSLVESVAMFRLIVFTGIVFFLMNYFYFQVYKDFSVSHLMLTTVGPHKLRAPHRSVSKVI